MRQKRDKMKKKIWRTSFFYISRFQTQFHFLAKMYNVQKNLSKFLSKIHAETNLFLCVSNLYIFLKKLSVF